MSPCTTLVAVQLEIGETLLASAEAYRRGLEVATAAALDVAQVPAGSQVLVVFPECAGHLALYALAPAHARKAKTLSGALAAAAIRRPLDVLRGVATAHVLDPKHAVLAALAPDGERFWRSVFGPLARKHGAHVVAGSHLRLAADGELTNASMLFGPDGRVLATTDKVNLVPGIEDGAPGALGLARGAVAKVPIVETPLGKVCTLICYDGFHVPHTSRERFDFVGDRVALRGGVDVAANPAANPWRWREMWPPKSLSGARTTFPTRADQWRREGLPGALEHRPFARYGVTAHLVGSVLDMTFEGSSEIIESTGLAVRTLASCEDPLHGGSASATV